jgi:hypothetical protein
MEQQCEYQQSETCHYLIKGQRHRIEEGTAGYLATEIALWHDLHMSELR